MKAVCWIGTGDIQVHQAPDLEILNPHDDIMRVTCGTICGSDHHLYEGYIPTLDAGEIFAHEFMRHPIGEKFAA